MAKQGSFRLLHELTNRLPSSAEAHRLFHELIDDGNHRAAAIAGAAYLENSLAEAITFQLKKIGATSVDELFRGDAPLGTFAAKIKFAYCIKLLGEKARHDFECIREIRNAFAHSKMRADFESPEIQIACWSITFPKWGSGPGAMKKEEKGATRVRFLATLTLYNEILEEAATPGRHDSKKFLIR